ncbi:MAG: hypothetical protein ABSE49_32580, partial [Polyangiaceae bacterium]
DVEEQASLSAARPDGVDLVFFDGGGAHRSGATSLRDALVALRKVAAVVVRALAEEGMRVTGPSVARGGGRATSRRPPASTSKS